MPVASAAAGLPPAARICFTAATCGLPAAYISGVLPSESVALESAPAARSVATTSGSSFDSAAAMRAVTPAASCSSTSAPAARRAFIMEECGLNRAAYWSAGPSAIIPSFHLGACPNHLVDDLSAGVRSRRIIQWRSAIRVLILEVCASTDGLQDCGRGTRACQLVNRRKCCGLWHRELGRSRHGDEREP